MWLDPDSVLMSGAPLEATMSQSKTSNMLKKADAMKIFVSATASISEKTWLAGRRIVRCPCFLCRIPTLIQ